MLAFLFKLGMSAEKRWRRIRGVQPSGQGRRRYEVQRRSGSGPGENRQQERRLIMRCTPDLTTARVHL